MSKPDKLPNLKVLSEIRFRGVAIPKGSVIPKGGKERSPAGFSTPEWKNLCNMRPPRLEETDEKVGQPKKAKAGADKAGAATIPGPTAS